MSAHCLILSLLLLPIAVTPADAAPRIEILSQTRQIVWSARADDAHGEVFKRVARVGPALGNWTLANETLAIRPDQRDSPLPVIQGATIASYSSSITARRLSATTGCEINLFAEDPTVGSGEVSCENNYEVRFRIAVLTGVALSGSLTTSGVISGTISLRTATGAVIVETAGTEDTLDFAANLPPGDYVFRVSQYGRAAFPVEEPGEFFGNGRGELDATMFFR